MVLLRLRSQVWFGYLGALFLTAVVTGVIALVRTATDVSNISMLYLLAVLAAAVLFGGGPAVAASLAAFLAFNFFFLEPRYRLTVAHEEEWVALGLLLITGIITGRLAAALRDRARQAERREREAVVLYDVARLMAEPDLSGALNAVAERLRAELGLAAAVIALDQAPIGARAEAGDAAALETARAAGYGPASILARGVEPTATQRGSPGRWIRVVEPRRQGRAGPARRGLVHKVPVSAGGRAIGMVLLVRHPREWRLRREDDRLLSAVAAQLGSAAEMVALREEATRAEVLRRTDELKTALLNAVSHELRTPLSSIIASAGSLLQKEVSWSADERLEFARAIEEEAQHLNRLVGNLLDMSRIEAGALQPDAAWYDLGALIDDVLGRLRPLTANHDMSVEVPPDLPPVLMDYVEIGQVLTNLMENAVRHTPAGTDVTVSVRRLDGSVEVEVRDTGPGIPQELMERLFEPFQRLSVPGRSGGTGLGLAVVRGMVVALGGTIRGEDRPEGGVRYVL